ncbi:MAG TPA: NAD/NADP octopine/nopaline dehydrogenase family protein [Negativicutes bacterium]|nr:NAD/NADP octopine/nopaline dehydrogenase family protein [Negativicutes bacterium]
MKIAVLGSGNGGCAVAFDCAKNGHEVSIFDFESFPANINAIRENGGICSEGQLEGFQKVAYAGFDIQEAIKDAELIYAVGPAYSTKAFGEACRPYLTKEQVVVVCPGSCAGSLVFKNALGVEVADDSRVVAETSTLPYAVRLTGPGRIHVFLRLKDGVLLAALPSKFTARVHEMMSSVYPYMIPANSVLQTSLQNANPIIHPSVTLLNAGLIERTKGDFFFYEEGVTQGIGRVIEALDKERMAIGKALGFNIIPDPELGMRQGYMQEPTYDKGYSEAEGFKGIKAQSSLDYRYLNEDVGYGLVFMSELGKQLGVPTPVADSVIILASVVMKRDYRAEKARTPESLGFGGFSPEQLKELL